MEYRRRTRRMYLYLFVYQTFFDSIDRINVSYYVQNERGKILNRFMNGDAWLMYFFEVSVCSLFVFQRN